MDQLLQSVDWWRTLHPILRASFVVAGIAGIGGYLVFFSQFALPLPAYLRWYKERRNGTSLLLKLGKWIALPVLGAILCGGVIGLLTALLAALKGLPGIGVTLLFIAMPILFWGLSLFIVAVFTVISRQLAKISQRTTEPKLTNQSEHTEDEQVGGSGLFVFATVVAVIVSLSIIVFLILKGPWAPWWARTFFALLLGGITWVFIVGGTIEGSEALMSDPPMHPGADADDYSRDMFGPGGRTGAI
jgi:hypothetical protein